MHNLPRDSNWQLAFEYNPQPRFRAAKPKDAGPELQRMMASES
jgi:hypothetical protein